MTTPRITTATAALSRARIPAEQRTRVVVVLDRAGRPQVFDRSAYAQRLASKDPAAAFLVSHEQVGPGQVLLVVHSESLGAKVRRIAMSDVFPIAVRVEGEDES